MKFGYFRIDIVGIVLGLMSIIASIVLFAIYVNRYKHKKTDKYFYLGMSIFIVIFGIVSSSVGGYCASRSYEYSTQLYSCQEHNNTVFVVNETMFYYQFKVKENFDDKEYKYIELPKYCTTIGYSGVSVGRMKAYKEPWKEPQIEIILPHETLYI